MEKQYQIIKPKHGYYKGECLDAEIAPTIDTGVGCWHTLIGESMEEVKCEQVGMLSGNSWDKCHETNRRVYSSNGLSPTITTMGGGQREPKIIEPRIAAMRGRNPDNPSDRTAGSPTEQRLEIGSKETSNTLTTVQKDNLVVEPVWDNDLGCFVDKNSGEWLIDGSERPPIEPAPQYRIRKLSERECFRLMGVKEQDFENVKKNQSMSSLYHLAGDSIVTTCLMAIFGELFSVDYQDKINSLTEELKNEI